jgi:hypothetical protein
MGGVKVMKICPRPNGKEVPFLKASGRRAAVMDAGSDDSFHSRRIPFHRSDLYRKGN